MEAADRDRLVALLHEGSVGSLSVILDGVPYVGLVPFVVTPEGSGVLVHVSGLARHTAGLGRGRPWALLVHEPTDRGANPQQLARVSLQGTSEPLERGTATWETARDLYLVKYPRSAVTFGLGDFTLIRLVIESVRFVAGFARTWDLEPSELEAPTRTG